MKTLVDQTILYDEDCPLCQTYTAAFIASGMLDKNGRKPYQDINVEEIPFLDYTKATNEIALVDFHNQKVIYGIDSLLQIIGFSFPLVKTVGKWKPINFLLKKSYAFISYNRKVILPSILKEGKTSQCEPTFNLKYRIGYILFAVFITSITLFKYTALLPFIPKANLQKEALITVGQLFFQSLFILGYHYKQILHYLGNVITVSIMGSLLLTPALLLNNFAKINPVVALLWFGITVMLMIIEHNRRISILHLPKYLTITWIIYRILVLLFLLNPLF